jgi:hypothetical protein
MLQALVRVLCIAKPSTLHLYCQYDNWPCQDSSAPLWVTVGVLHFQSAYLVDIVFARIAEQERAWINQK